MLVEKGTERKEMVETEMEEEIQGTIRTMTNIRWDTKTLRGGIAKIAVIIILVIVTNCWDGLMIQKILKTNTKRVVGETRTKKFL